MSANVETMFYVKEKPWHGLGERVEDALNSKQALEKAGLDWKVLQKKVFVDGYSVPQYKANVRSSDGKVLGIVSDKYKIVQNVDAFEFTDNIIGNGEIEVKYETAGSLASGKKIWLLAKMPTTTILGDDVEPYMVFTNTHDGSGSIRVAMTPVRVVCQNTLTMVNLHTNSVGQVLNS
jgi:phage/plasmid-like protein (TIGR03299 family)